MQVDEIPNTAIDSAFGALRWPLDRVAPYVSGGHPESWPPVLVLGEIEVAVKRSLGSVLHNDTLRNAAGEQAERIDALRSAAQVEAAAEYLEEKARDEFESKRAAVAQRESETSLRARERKEQTRQRANERRSAAKAEAERKQVSLEKAERTRLAAVEKKARPRRITALDAETKALQREQAAIAAKREEARADQALRAKAARRNTSPRRKAP